jgi:hypothetical protein
MNDGTIKVGNGFDGHGVYLQIDCIGSPIMPQRII